MRTIHTTPLLAVLLAACGSTVQTETDINPQYSAEIRDWRSYAWMDGQDETGDRVYNDITMQRVREAVDREMAARGYTLDSDNPDFKVTWYGSLDDEIDVQTITDPYGYSWRDWYFGPRVRTLVNEYTEGTLILDFVDADQNELAWRGVAQGRLSGSPPELPTQSEINEAVDEIMEEFPARVTG